MIHILFLQQEPAHVKQLAYVVRKIPAIIFFKIEFASIISGLKMHKTVQNT